MPVTPRPLIIKVDATRYRQDKFTDRLIEAGYQVVKAKTIKDGIKLARRSKPSLIIAVDNPEAGIKADTWLEIQHSDVEPTLALTPLLIVADSQRANRLRVHELPDRVKVIQRPIQPDTLIRDIDLFLTTWF